MNSVLLGVDENPGFSFRNCIRNANLLKTGFNPPEAKKTGTTIVGMIFKDGVVLGADTKTTRGQIIDSDSCEKITRIEDNIYAGLVADFQMTCRWVASNMELLRRNTNRKHVPVRAAVTFVKQYNYRFQGGFNNHFVFGGVDNEGSHIYSVHSYGSVDRVPYATVGSGSLAAMSVFETRWRPDMTEEEAVKLVNEAVSAGINNDLGSGYAVDVAIVKKGSHKIIRGTERRIKHEGKKTDFTYKRGTTGVLKKFEIEIINEEKETIEADNEDVSMEVD